LLNIPIKNPSPARFANQVVVSTPSKNYTASDIPQLYQLAGLTLMENIYPTLQQQQPNPYPTHPGVNIYCFWGTGFSTAVGPIYNSDNFNELPSAEILINGDCVHTDITNSACTAWNTSTQYQFMGQGFQGVNHGDMASNTVVLQTVVQVALKGKQEITRRRKY